jgi:putative addiction module component (TIGR02574 family)
VTEPARRIFEEAMCLSEPDRRMLAEALMDSVGEVGDEIDGAWREEVLRRIDQVRNGEVTLEPWSEVRRQMREARRR